MNPDYFLLTLVFLIAIGGLILAKWVNYKDAKKHK